MSPTEGNRSVPFGEGLAARPFALKADDGDDEGPVKGPQSHALTGPPLTAPSPSRKQHAVQQGEGAQELSA